MRCDLLCTRNCCDFVLWKLECGLNLFFLNGNLRARKSYHVDWPAVSDSHCGATDVIVRLIINSIYKFWVWMLRINPTRQCLFDCCQKIHILVYLRKWLSKQSLWNTLYTYSRNTISDCIYFLPRLEL